MESLKPFRLTPQYRDYVWGGNRIRRDGQRTAEAWVVYEDDLISDGPYAGHTLKEASQDLGAALLGTVAVTRTGSKFPLLIKILDCEKWLSLQVHPNNAQAEKWEGAGHFGKMEAWYVIHADEGAQLISGFQAGVEVDAVRESIGKKALLELAGWKVVKTGDSLLIRPGLLHALGPGLLIYEVQQTSDLTYRIYDWDRPLRAGRKLHIEQAEDVLAPRVLGDISYSDFKFTGKKDLIHCEYFQLVLVKNIAAPQPMDTKGISFHAVTVVKGEGAVHGDSWSMPLSAFETILIPASCGRYSLESGQASYLIASVPG